MRTFLLRLNPESPDGPVSDDLVRCGLVTVCFNEVRLSPMPWMPGDRYPVLSLEAQFESV